MAKKKFKTSAVFNEDSRREFLTGFKKRKDERRKKADNINQEKARKAKLQVKKQKREALLEQLETWKKATRDPKFDGINSDDEKDAANEGMTLKYGKKRKREDEDGDEDEEEEERDQATEGDQQQESRDGNEDDEDDPSEVQTMQFSDANTLVTTTIRLADQLDIAPDDEELLQKVEKKQQKVERAKATGRAPSKSTAKNPKSKTSTRKKPFNFKKGKSHKKSGTKSKGAKRKKQN
eukprot:GILK01005546.1.p1 GENE.GILK01005546.1~~GILK01005546.1.p1  ORF type:complete len:249 (-),score=75.91 GILK01005546.1:172-879(-)